MAHRVVYYKHSISLYLSILDTLYLSLYLYNMSLYTYIYIMSYRFVQ